MQKQNEAIFSVPLSELHPFPDHPFKVRDDEAMTETAESVKDYGILVPAIVRPREDGGYEIIAGHRRKHACELAGLDAMPVIVRELDDDAATIIMVDSNMQRENILPSERAQAYKMKMEAIKRQAGRPSKNSPQVAANFRSDDEVAKADNVSGDTVRRYIRLTELQYVGIAADEAWRCKDKQYPLVEWGITEAEALQICYDRGFDFGGLYEIYHRPSCWCCPLQRIGELRKLRKYHPELWARLMDMDNRAREYFGPGPLGQFKQNWSVERLEERFAREDA